jgi:hypothetical protein
MIGGSFHPEAMTPSVPGPILGWSVLVFHQAVSSSSVYLLSTEYGLASIYTSNLYCTCIGALLSALYKNLNTIELLALEDEGLEGFGCLRLR